VSARVWLGIAAASLLLAACGERVEIGDNDPIAVSPPSTSSTPPSPPDPPPGVCANAPCGLPCPLAPCIGMGCSPSTGGYCDLGGKCSLAMPECPDANASCVGHPCGAPCDPPTPCDPADPDCTVTTDPPKQCNALQQCQLGPVSCP
jgi:hypothetical protein